MRGSEGSGESLSVSAADGDREDPQDRFGKEMPHGIGGKNGQAIGVEQSNREAREAGVENVGYRQGSTMTQCSEGEIMGMSVYQHRPSLSWKGHDMTSPCESVSPCVCEKPDCGIPYGLCHCGCGGNAPVAPRNNKFYKWIKGKPKRYIAGHGCSRINKPYLIEDRGYESPCWIWEFSLTSQGYASVEFGGKKHYVHRINYQKFVGSIPEGYELDHLCENRCCVNPYHLEPADAQRECEEGGVSLF